MKRKTLASILRPLETSPQAQAKVYSRACINSFKAGFVSLIPEGNRLISKKAYNTETYSLAVIQTNLAPLHHVYQTTRCGNQQVAAPLQVTNLLANVSSSIYDTRAYSRTIGKLEKNVVKEKHWIELGFAGSKIMFSDLNFQSYLPSLIIDLESQFPSWSQNQRKGVLLTASVSAVFLQQRRNPFGQLQMNNCFISPPTTCTQK